MNDEACKVLFEALAQILSNQQDILRHLGVAKHDSEWGWSDTDISNMISELNSMAYSYEHND